MTLEVLVSNLNNPTILFFLLGMVQQLSDPEGRVVPQDQKNIFGF
jgi:hypothetical protein